MSTSVSIAGHPLHPMLVVFPIGLWIFSLISDFVFLLRGDPTWNDVAFYTMAGGLVGALFAAVPGFIDMFSISDPKVGKMAWNHMLLNLMAVAIFALKVLSTHRQYGGRCSAHFVIGNRRSSHCCLGLAPRELVYVHGMGVQQRSAAATNRPRR